MEISLENLFFDIGPLMGYSPFIAALQPTSVLLEKPISTLILLKVKLFIHIIQDALMIFAYPYPEQTGVNKLSFFTLRKTGTAFQMI